MNKIEELNNYRNVFNEQLSIRKGDANALMELFERYYNYLDERFNEEGSDTNEYVLAFMQCCYKIAYTVVQNNIKCRELSNSWNNFLVSRVYNLSSEKRQLKEQYRKDFNKEVIDLFKQVRQEKDFPTKAYCITVMQNDGLIDFSSAERIDVTKNTAKQTTPRAAIAGAPIEDDGMKYWHTGAKELMTYDECTEKHLGHHLLAYPIGNEKAGLYVGFDEPDRNLVEKCENEEVNAWVDNVLECKTTTVD